MSADQELWKVPTEFPPAEVRVRWGQLDNQTMPLPWAEQFIALVYTRWPGVFRAILPELYGLPDEPKRGRKAGNA